MINNPNPHENDFYGQELILNLYDCNIKTISSGRKIKEFVIKLKLKNTLKETKDKISHITESLPHPHGVKAIKSNIIETEKKFKESKKSKIERDLKEIQDKLEELSK